MTVISEQLEAAADRVEELQAALAAALVELESKDAEISALHVRIAKLAAQPRTVDLKPDEAFSDTDAWVMGWLCRQVERVVGSRYRWCARWAEHPEAVMRLDLMFAEYTRAMADRQLGMSAFIRNSLDYHLPHLLAADGPFAGCDPRRHEAAMTLGA